MQQMCREEYYETSITVINAWVSSSVTSVLNVVRMAAGMSYLEDFL